MLDAQGTLNSECVGVVVELQIATRGHVSTMYDVTGEIGPVPRPRTRKLACGMQFIDPLLSSIAHPTSHSG